MAKLKGHEIAIMLAAGAGVLWYIQRNKAQAVQPPAVTTIDYINPASEHFVVNQVTKVVGIDLNAIGKRLGAGLYDLIH